MTAIWNWAIASMKGLVCAVIYWCVYWIWGFFEQALDYIPSWLTDPLAQFGDKFDDWFRLIDTFLPLHETVVIVVSYYTVMLYFRGFEILNSIRKI